MQAYKLLQQDSVLLSQPLLIEHFGRAGAQFLSQLHYWLEKKDSIGCTYQGSHWIYNSAEDWAQQLHLSVRQIRRLISKFVESGVLRVKKLSPYKSVRTNYYSIDYEILNRSISQQTNKKTRSFVHGDILSSSSCRNGTIYNDTKTTNKDINKSEEPPLERAGHEESEKKQVEPVKQVEILIPKKQKKEEKKADNTNSSEDILLTKNSGDKKETGKTSTTQNMLAIWNETFNQKAKASMSKDLAPLLVSAYHKKFAQNLEQWQRYCGLIKSSPYLMGEQFQLSIFWGLKFSTIDRIRAGEFGVAKQSSIGNGEGQGSASVFNNNQIEQMIEALSESREAKTTRLKIARTIGAAAYYSWFHQARFETRGEKIQLVAPNSFVEQAWETQFPWINKNAD